MNLRYLGAFLDYSGYGEAVRHDIGALFSGGANISTQYVKFGHGTSNFGRLGNLCQRLKDRSVDYKIKILHVTPNLFPKFVEPEKYNIGRVFWETDKLPPDFAQGCRVLDEIWTGSETNKQAIINAGVTDIPIYIIPEAIEENVANPLPFKTDIDDKFVFYSVFEWTSRKNPEILLRAFFNEFSADDGVALMIKTYVDDFTSGKRDEIMSEIKTIKKEFGDKKLPPLYLYTHLMDRSQVHRFHATGDCFISATRGEGWGIPQMEAMLFGKPVITTRCGGIADHLTHEVDAHLIDTKMRPIGYSSRNSQWYRSDQNWAECHLADVRAAMRKVYSDATYAKRLANAGQKTVFTHFTLKAVGDKMIKRLKIIEQEMEAAHANESEVSVQERTTPEPVSGTS